MSFCNLNTKDDQQDWLSRQFLLLILFPSYTKEQPNLFLFFMDVNLTSGSTLMDSL